MTKIIKNVKLAVELTIILCKTKAMKLKQAMAGPQVTHAVTQLRQHKWYSGSMAQKNGAIYQVATFTLPQTGHLQRIIITI